MPRDAVRDLRARLDKAASVLAQMAEKSAGPEKQRLTGKKQGVELALSYLDELENQ